MGAVWVARHEQLDIDVAVKLMAPALAGTASAGARFEREAKAAAQLKSPHVVQIHDYGVDGEAPYIVMELLEGEDLDALLSREKRLEPARAAEILGQAAKALRVAHEAGVVHRDLKPANIFLARAGGELLVKILDFGIAKETAPASTVKDRTTTGVVLGSPLYMSPEQARGAAVGAASDLWSLAVVAFELVTGSHPFMGASVGDVIAKICGDELPVPSRHLPGLSAGMDAFFEKALRRNPARRFGSARELADAFAAVAAAQPALAPPAVTPSSIPPPGVAPASTRSGTALGLGREAETLAAPVVATPSAPSLPAAAVSALTGGTSARPDTAERPSVVALGPTVPGPPPAAIAPAGPAPTPAPPARRRLVVIAAVLAAGALGTYLVAGRSPAATPLPAVRVASPPASLPPPGPVEPAPAVEPAVTAPSASSAPAVPASAPRSPAAPASAPRSPAALPGDRPRGAPRPTVSVAVPPANTPPAIDPVFGLPVQK
jgi:serine/threonine-protein kinase